MTTKPRAKTLRKAEDLQPDPANPNRGTKRGLDLLETSLEKFGAVRSIAVDRNGVTIAGAKTLQSAVDKKIPIEVVRSDGKKLIVVQRTDLDMNEPMARAAGIADNRVSEIGLEWDAEIMASLKDEGVDVSDFWFDDELAKFLDEVPPEEQDGGAAAKGLECPRCQFKF